MASDPFGNRHLLDAVILHERHRSLHSSSESATLLRPNPPGYRDMHLLFWVTANLIRSLVATDMQPP
jgi:hypothetical protein